VNKDNVQKIMLSNFKRIIESKVSSKIFQQCLWKEIHSQQRMRH